ALTDGGCDLDDIEVVAAVRDEPRPVARAYERLLFLRKTVVGHQSFGFPREALANIRALEVERELVELVGARAGFAREHVGARRRELEIDVLAHCFCPRGPALSGA